MTMYVYIYIYIYTCTVSIYIKGPYAGEFASHFQTHVFFRLVILASETCDGDIRMTGFMMTV